LIIKQYVVDDMLFMLFTFRVSDLGELNAQPQRWTKFTYTGKETRYITKLFKKLDIWVTFTTENSILHLL
jgi:hypothetical protein